jgi:hypothetical protein
MQQETHTTQHASIRRRDSDSGSRRVTGTSHATGRGAGPRAAAARGSHCLTDSLETCHSAAKFNHDVANDNSWPVAIPGVPVPSLIQSAHSNAANTNRRDLKTVRAGSPGPAFRVAITGPTCVSGCIKFPVSHKFTRKRGRRGWIIQFRTVK